MHEKSFITSGPELSLIVYDIAAIRTLLVKAKRRFHQSLEVTGAVNVTGSSRAHHMTDETYPSSIAALAFSYLTREVLNYPGQVWEMSY